MTRHQTSLYRVGTLNHETAQAYQETSTQSYACHHVRRLTVKPGRCLSLRKHFHRAEHCVVVRGTAEVTVNDKVVLRHENEGIHLPIGCVHRLANPGRIDLELIEVQVGSHTGKDDIVRSEDDHGR